jgi:hypothetical protein
MAKVMTDESNYSAIANQIRSKLGVSTRYKPSEMAAAIGSISGVSSSDNGKVVVNGQLTQQTSRNVSQNGTYDTTTNNEVVVNVSEGSSIPYWNEPIIRNWDFANPINTRGQQSYSSNVSTINGWRTDGSTSMKVVTDGINVQHKSGSSNTNTNMFYQQRFNFAAFVGQKLTASMLANGDLKSSTFVIPSSNGRMGDVTIDDCTFWVNRDSSTAIAVGFEIPASVDGESILIQAIKLEFGESQTLAMQKNTGWELVKSSDESTEECLGYTMATNW